MMMAKTQDLQPNPGKLSGVCGKLLCCLSYENEQYVQSRRVLPKLGQDVMTEQGPGYVAALHILKELVTVRLDSGEDVVLPPAEIQFATTADPGASNRRRRRPRRDTAAPQQGNEE
jgi:cell fate regulator YaaT (PSP1 superfamily)